MSQDDTGVAQPTVLIVDDEVDIREALTEVLTDEGYDVLSAANGREALNRLLHARPCVILLDLMMPIMNGWEFRAQQQQDPLLAAIPVLVISADGQVAQKAASLGANGYIAKPFELDNLLATLATFC